MNDLLLLADLVIAIAAVFGLVATRLHLGPATEGLAVRFRMLLAVAILFYGARALNWATDVWVFRTLAITAAVALPLGALLLAEALLRRHAPGWMKVLIAGGAGVLILTAILGIGTASMAFVLGLLIFQIAAFALIAGLIVARDRGSLGSSENSNIDRISLSFLAILPFLLTDYQLGGFPVRMSGLAALIVCWLAVKLEDRARTVAQLALSALSTLVVAGGIAWLAAVLTDQVSIPMLLRLWATTASILMALRIALDVASVRAGRARQSISETLRRGSTLDDYLAGLRRSDLAEGHTFLSGNALRDFDVDRLIAAFGPSGSFTRASLPKDARMDEFAQSQIRSLLDRFSATTAYLVAETPPIIAVGQPGGLLGGPDADLEAAFGLSRLIAARNATLKEGDDHGRHDQNR